MEVAFRHGVQETVCGPRAGAWSWTMQTQPDVNADPDPDPEADVKDETR
jgi:hypothetical protein